MLNKIVVYILLVKCIADLFVVFQRIQVSGMKLKNYFVTLCCIMLRLLIHIFAWSTLDYIVKEAVTLALNYN